MKKSKSIAIIILLGVCYLSGAIGYGRAQSSPDSSTLTKAALSQDAQDIEQAKQEAEKVSKEVELEREKAVKDAEAVRTDSEKQAEFEAQKAEQELTLINQQLIEEYVSAVKKAQA
ncbi:MAG: hypothetical protein KKA52_08135, partial [Candidatus Omnitrophica bacterium]|nr:hypothetical protein [Candidatus Omnitrophota bacterium]